jgi:hypothetical protein
VRRPIAIASLVLLIVSAVGLLASLPLNIFLLDEFDAYGEVYIPGTRTLHLPAGDVTISFDSVYPQGVSTADAPIPIPKGLEVTITPPRGVAKPAVTDVTESDRDCGTYTGTREGSCTLLVAHIPQAGDYTITTNGKVTPSLNPRLAVGHPSRFWFVTWLFGGLCVVSLLVKVGSNPSAARSDAPPPTVQPNQKTEEPAVELVRRRRIDTPATTDLSQVCLCGERNKRALKQRVHRCGCGITEHRDLLSAYLGLHVGRDADGFDRLELQAANTGWLQHQDIDGRRDPAAAPNQRGRRHPSPSRRSVARINARRKAKAATRHSRSARTSTTDRPTALLR